MSYQDNVNIAHALFDALNKRDHARWLALHDANSKAYTSGQENPLDAEQIWAYLDRFFIAFPDVQWEIMQAIAGAHHVVVHWNAAGTNLGPLRAPSGRDLLPTCRRGRLLGATTFRIENGLITQSWLFWDMGSLLVQLGLLTL